MITIAGPGANWQGKVWRRPGQQVIEGKTILMMLARKGGARQLQRPKCNNPKPPTGAD